MCTRGKHDKLLFLCISIFIIILASLSPPTRCLGLPPSFDWRDNNGGNYITPVRNQDGCGSCSVFSTTAGLESQALISSGWPGFDLDLSEQIVISCSGLGSCEWGFWPAQVSQFLRSTGTNIESTYPYTATNGDCTAATPGWQAGVFMNTNPVQIATPVTADDIKWAIYNYGPIGTVFRVYTDFQIYTGGIYVLSSWAVFSGGTHSVLVIGWDDAVGAFIVKNSWGTDWGEAGYFTIAYSELTSDVLFGNTGMIYYVSGASWQCTNAKIRISETGWGYSVPQDAYDAAVDGQTIQMATAPPYTGTLGSLSLDRDISVTLRGGYDCLYYANSANMSSVSGIAVSSGSVIIDGIVIH